MPKAKPKIPLGLLFSTVGSYEVVSRSMLQGAALALQQINQSDAYDFCLEPCHRDPMGCVQAYSTLAEELLTDSRLKHVIGCYTSSSRKEIIPAFEKHDALLWYPSHYEGFETCDNVIYTGAAPNHHIVPLMKHVLGQIGGDIYCVGSNYVWAWENNRIVRELSQAAGGTVLAERYLQVNDRGVERIVNEIRDLKPSFVFNSLIGESSYAFYRAFSKEKQSNPDLRNTVVGSCSLCEPELQKIGRPECAGHISSSVYFSSLPGIANERFVESYRRLYGQRSISSADAEASYITVYFLAEAISRASSSDINAVRSALHEIELDAPQGRVKIDGSNNHCYLTPRLGVSTDTYTFDVIYESTSAVAPDPYLVWQDCDSLISNNEKGFADIKDGGKIGQRCSLRVVK